VSTCNRLTSAPYAAHATLLRYISTSASRMHSAELLILQSLHITANVLHGIDSTAVRALYVCMTTPVPCRSVTLENQLKEFKKTILEQIVDTLRCEKATLMFIDHHNSEMCK
jgi:hypothetical protein